MCCTELPRRTNTSPFSFVVATGVGHSQAAAAPCDAACQDTVAGTGLCTHPMSLPHVWTSNAGATPPQIAWSPSQPGLLATICSQERWISLWDLDRCPATTADGSAAPQRRIAGGDQTLSFDAAGGAKGASAGPASAAPHRGTLSRNTASAVTIAMPYRRRFMHHPLASISWEPPAAAPGGGGLKSNRMLTVSWSGLVEDVCLLESLPVSLAPSGGFR